MGIDPSKVGAAAVNGIIFIAQMVRSSFRRMMSMTAAKMFDWYKISDFIKNRMKNYEKPQNVYTLKI